MAMRAVVVIVPMPGMICRIAHRAVLARSRALSMITFATGLMVRCLSVTMPTGGARPGSSTGSTLIASRLGLKRSSERGNMAMYGPIVSIATPELADRCYFAGRDDGLRAPRWEQL